MISKKLGAPLPSESRAILTSPEPTQPPKKTYRKGISPAGSLPLKLTRSEYNYLPLIDMNDRGDFLYLTSPANATFRSYLHVYNGKSVQSPPTSTFERWTLSPNGSIVKRMEYAVTVGGARNRLGGGGWAFNEYRFFRRTSDDGWTTYIEGVTKKKVQTFRLLKDKPTVGTIVLYTSNNLLTILEIDDQNAVWVREYRSLKGSDDSQLLRFADGKAERIPFAPGYKAVDRLSSTGKTLAATFGNVTSTEPYRAFVRKGPTWHELPIPPGAMFSYVQKVFYNGDILGFVTDQNRLNFQQVVWRGDSVAILTDLPAWPKRGKYSLITRASRKGDIYVRSVLNSESGASENYMLNIR